MANLLKKDIKTTFIPGHAAVPANPGQPYLPPRTVTVTTRVCRTVPVQVFAPLNGG